VKLRHLVNYLKNGKNYDLYISEDVSKNNIEIFDVPILKHSVSMFQQQGYCPINHPDYKWTMTELPLYHSRDCLPDYEYYIQVDYDVHFSGRTPDYLDQLCEIVLSKKIDMCIGDLSIRPADWFWGAKFRAIYIDQEVIWGSFPALMVLSARAIDYLKGIRQLEAKIFQHQSFWDHYACVEVFLGTHMINNKQFISRDLNDVWPNSYVFETYNHKDTFFLEQEHSLQTELHHSVLDNESYMVKCLHGAYTQHRPENLSAMMDNEYFTDLQRQRLREAYTDLKNRLG
jgi:hypothetical protein